MAIYQVQGPNGEIITIEGPENANPNDVIAQAQSLYKPKEEKSAMAKFAEPFKDVSLKDWAQKSLLAPALQTMQSVSPFGILRPDVAAMNLKQGSQNLGGKVGQMAQGAYNVATNPVEAAQKAYTAVTENPAGVAGEMAKGLLYDPEMLIGSGLGTVAEKGLMSAGRGVKGAVQAPINFGRGFTEGYFNPQGARQGISATVPLKEKYYPANTAEQFTAGKIGLPELEASQVPSASLFNTPALKKGLDIASKNELGQPMIPLQGRKMEAFGEQLGREYANKPLAGAIDILGAIGGVATTGVPLTPSAAMRAYQGYKTRQLGQAANFNPEFPQKLTQAQGRAGIQGQMPQTPLLTNNPSAPGPVNPNTMYVAPEGVAGTNINQVSQAGAQQKYAPQPVPQTPAQQSQQMAAQKLQQVQQTPVTDPAMLARQQAMQEQIRQRALQQKQQPAPASVQAPVVPTDIQSLPTERWTPAEKLALEKAKLQENPPPAPTITPEDIAQQKQAVAQSASQYRGQVVREWVKGNNMVEGVPLDTSKNAYNGSNRTRAQAEKLMKAGIDSIPKLEGVTEAQTINAMVEHLEKTNPNIFKGKKKGPKNVSQMIIDDGSSTWNSMKLPDNASPVERRIALMSQAERDRLQSNLQQSLDPNNPMHKEYLDMFNKYRIK